MYIRKPEWLKVKLVGNSTSFGVEHLLKELNLNTVCGEALCPNRMECFHKGTATFMILGKNCTRNCTFCNVTKNKPEPVNKKEPENLAKAVEKLQLKHVVVTSVTRDDLADGGASHFVNVINEVKKLNNSVTIEVLIPDFQGNKEWLKLVVDAKPDIINHNVETVPSLYSTVRPRAIYTRSLKLLEDVKNMDKSRITKSGIMLGLGEKKEEVVELMKDLRGVQCDILTIGQYLQPSEKHHEVIEYVHPDIFEEYGEIGRKLGFKYVASSPLVRSSYNAQDVFKHMEVSF
ncbi:lipoyl synthase [Clostridium amazonitimonense]|uniref:lipoyl synthase n=1 Tax=Clostridium amazonitimonense TaxID=1499689 RepID=UPI0005099EE0|nr:lipoyl synthase [Clostridium amazonitimonense]